MQSATVDSPYKVTLDNFEGPLDLLLHLIREQKLNIYDIPIARVCEQYLAYISLMEAMDLEVASEWLVMAATLVEIKSRMLLPKEVAESDEDEPSDPRMELVERLIEYEKIKGAAELFKEKEELQSHVFVRGAPLSELDIRPRFDLQDITAEDLLAALRRILYDVSEEEVTTIQRRSISLRMRMKEILSLVTAHKKLRFEQLFEGDRTVHEVVMTFLGLLELVNRKRLKVKQAGPYLPLEIWAVNGTVD